MRRTALAFALALGLASSAHAQTVTIKLGTLAPDGSNWHNLLKEMGEKWAEASGGKVKLKIYPGGVAGNEGDMVRKLRVGQLQAAAISVVGLHDIETSAQGIACPGMMADDAEFQAVFDKMIPVFNKRFEQKGFVNLMWGDTGQVYVFEKKPLKPEQTKGLKMFAWAGDPASVKAWELAGFTPVVISSTDILPSLSTGMIEAFANSPVLAFTARWYEQAPYMIDFPWGHLPGSTIITKEAWEKIPADLRPKLMEIAQEYGKRVNAEVLKLQNDALTQMKKNGLKVVELNEAERKLWQQMAEKTWAAVRGGVVTPEAFDEIKKVRDEYRASKGQK
jgi:TRAP-type C4-dicarboxylate transport system substrate-binding protein